MSSPQGPSSQLLLWYEWYEYVPPNLGLSPRNCQATLSCGIPLDEAGQLVPDVRTTLQDHQRCESWAAHSRAFQKHRTSPKGLNTIGTTPPVHRKAGLPALPGFSSCSSLVSCIELLRPRTTGRCQQALVSTQHSVIESESTGAGGTNWTLYHLVYEACKHE